MFFRRRLGRRGELPSGGRATEAFCCAARLWPHYELPWAASTLIHRAVEQADMTSAEFTGLRVPTPRGDLERQIYAGAQTQLNEIFALRAEKRRRAAADATFDSLPDAGGNVLSSLLAL
jgi:hypothetical protein